MLFNPGNLVATPGALELAVQGVNLPAYLQRHLKGDWGDLCQEDQAQNNRSLCLGFRLLSSYETPHGMLWIITEADRSATTFLIPEEY